MKGMKGKIAILYIPLLFCITLSWPGITWGELEIPIGDKSLRVAGFIKNQSMLRNKNFNFNPLSLVSSRNTVQLELSLNGLINAWGPIDRVDLVFMPRVTYEGIYDLRPDAYGNSGPAFRLRYGHGPRTSGYPGFGYLPDGTPLQPPGPIQANVPLRPNGTHPIFNFMNFNPLAHGRVKLRGGQNVEVPEYRLKWDRTDSNEDWPIRELYIDITAGSNWFRIGKQQVVWGKTDFFRLQDIPNPFDYSWHGFYDDFEDLRIPLWMVRYQRLLGDFGPVKNVSLELVWNFDNPEPTGLGQAGQPWAHPFADEIRWFSMFGSAVPFLGLYREHLPRAWRLANTELGARLEWRLGDFTLALTNWYGMADDPFFNLNILYTQANPHPLLGLTWGGALGIEYYRNNVSGLSVDYFEPHTKTIWRLESSYTNKTVVTATERLKDPGTPGLFYRGRDVHARTPLFQWALGIDRPTMIRWINPLTSIFLSTQIFHKWLPSHYGGAKDGFANPEHEFIFTFVADTKYWRDRLHFLLWTAYHPTGQALTGGLNFEWLITNHWSFRINSTLISGKSQRHNGGVAFAPLYGGAYLDPNIPGGIDPYTNPLAAAWQPARPFGIIRENFGAYKERDEMMFALMYRF